MTGLTETLEDLVPNFCWQTREEILSMIQDQLYFEFGSLNPTLKHLVNKGILERRTVENMKLFSNPRYEYKRTLTMTKKELKLHDAFHKAFIIFQSSPDKTELELAMIDDAVEAFKNVTNVRKAATFFHDVFSKRTDKTKEEVKALKTLMIALLA